MSYFSQQGWIYLIINIIITTLVLIYTLYYYSNEGSYFIAGVLFGYIIITFFNIFMAYYFTCLTFGECHFLSWLIVFFNSILPFSFMIIFVIVMIISFIISFFTTSSDKTDNIKNTSSKREEVSALTSNTSKSQQEAADRSRAESRIAEEAAIARAEAEAAEAAVEKAAETAAVDVVTETATIE